MDNTRLLNTAHAILYPKVHLYGRDGHGGAIGYASGLVKMLKAHDFRNTALWWCPVCTLAALWLWMTGKGDA